MIKLTDYRSRYREKAMGPDPAPDHSECSAEPTESDDDAPEVLKRTQANIHRNKTRKKAPPWTRRRRG